VVTVSLSLMMTDSSIQDEDSFLVYIVKIFKLFIKLNLLIFSHNVRMQKLMFLLRVLVPIAWHCNGHVYSIYYSLL